jgi:hypothetical protein
METGGDEWREIMNSADVQEAIGNNDSQLFLVAFREQAKLAGLVDGGGSDAWKAATNSPAFLKAIHSQPPRVFARVYS